jgi:hypothetical protein
MTRALSLLALPIALLLAAQAPDAPTDERLHVRGALPRVTVAVGLPVATITPAHALLAALWSEPRAFHVDEVQQLRARGGELKARLLPDGLLLVVEADARDARLAVAAARAALAPAAFDAAGPPGAHARALVSAAMASADRPGELTRSVGRAWLGAQSPWGRLVHDDVTLLATTLAEADAARAALSLEQASWFASGRVPADLLADVPRPATQAVVPSPPWRQRNVGVVGTRGGLSQPLPPTPLTDALAPALCAWIVDAGWDAGVRAARVEAARGVRLLVIELHSGVDPTRLGTALQQRRAGIARARDLEPALVAGRATRARADGAHGAWAVAQAERALAGVAPAGDDEVTKEALYDLVRGSFLPEVMRPGDDGRGLSARKR